MRVERWRERQKRERNMREDKGEIGERSEKEFVESLRMSEGERVRITGRQRGERE